MSLASLSFLVFASKVGANTSVVTFRYGLALPGNPYRRGRLSTVDLLFRSAAFDIVNINSIFTKQPILERRSTVLSLPLQLVFLGLH